MNINWKAVLITAAIMVSVLGIILLVITVPIVGKVMLITLFALVVVFGSVGIYIGVNDIIN